ncbi:uncharacterized protein [Pyrus communis]|uniref:uncharacterized protein n=1 Tax=Pyrus communis TaxID=23211 RepID=UPI0035C056F5
MEQQKRLLAQQEELINLQEGGDGDEAFATEEDSDDDHRRQRASHSRHVMEAVGLFPKQKITAALRMLTYGAPAYQVDEITMMEKTTVLESLMQFCSTIKALYTNEYLRTPTPRDMRRLLRKREMSAAKLLDVKALRSIMMTCIILHNMIAEDEYDYDAVDEYEPDPMNNSRTRIYYVRDQIEDPCNTGRWNGMDVTMN